MNKLFIATAISSLFAASAFATQPGYTSGTSVTGSQGVSAGVSGVASSYNGGNSYSAAMNTQTATVTLSTTTSDAGSSIAGINTNGTTASIVGTTTTTGAGYALNYSTGNGTGNASSNGYSGAYAGGNLTLMTPVVYGETGNSDNEEALNPTSGGTTLGAGSGQSYAGASIGINANTNQGGFSGAYVNSGFTTSVGLQEGTDTANANSVSQGTTTSVGFAQANTTYLNSYTMDNSGNFTFVASSPDLNNGAYSNQVNAGGSFSGSGWTGGSAAVGVPAATVSVTDGD